MAAKRWGRAVGRDQACKKGHWGPSQCRGGQLGVTKPAEEGSWGQLGLQGRTVVRDQVGRGGQLGVTRPAGEGS